MEGKWGAAFLETILQTLGAVTLGAVISLQVPVGDDAPCAHSVPVPRCGGAGQSSCQTPGKAGVTPSGNGELVACSL